MGPIGCHGRNMPCIECGSCPLHGSIQGVCTPACRARVCRSAQGSACLDQMVALLHNEHLVDRSADHAQLAGPGVHWEELLHRVLQLVRVHTALRRQAWKQMLLFCTQIKLASLVSVLLRTLPLQRE